MISSPLRFTALCLLAAATCLAEHGPRQPPEGLVVPPELADDFYQHIHSGEESNQADDEPVSVSVWPPEQLPFGQIVGLAVDAAGNVHVFHRGSRVWDEDSFDDKNVFKHEKDGAIAEPTYVVLDGVTGEMLTAEGEGQYYMPHGLTLDHEGNAWLTDVAMHQVFKVPAGTNTPSLVLGEKFVPGSDDKHFCKPTDVAVASTGEFFVGDGYCNSRIMKFAADGTFITSFGKPTAATLMPASPGTFQIPHSVALVEDWNLLCVADRENERIQCFTAGITHDGKTLPTGILLKTASNLGRVFAIRAKDHYLYGVTNMGAESEHNVVFKVDLRNGEAVTEAPGLENPHCIAVADDDSVYVGEAGPNRILKID